MSNFLVIGEKFQISFAFFPSLSKAVGNNWSEVDFLLVVTLMMTSK